MSGSWVSHRIAGLPLVTEASSGKGIGKLRQYWLWTLSRVGANQGSLDGRSNALHLWTGTPGSGGVPWPTGPLSGVWCRFSTGLWSVQRGAVRLRLWPANADLGRVRRPADSVSPLSNVPDRSGIWRNTASPSLLHRRHHGNLTPTAGHRRALASHAVRSPATTLDDTAGQDSKHPRLGAAQ